MEEIAEDQGGLTVLVYKNSLAARTFSFPLLFFSSHPHQRFSSPVLRALLHSLHYIYHLQEKHAITSSTFCKTTFVRSELPRSCTLLLLNCIIATKTPKHLVQQSKMSHSPATPDKAGMHADGSESKAPRLPTDKLTSNSKIKQASLNEPSPASTYGDTIAGGSSPATPLDVGSHGKCMCSFPACHLPRSVFCLAS